VIDANPSSRRVVEDATCLGCACLCDDIGVVVEGDRIVEATRACSLGRSWYGSGTIAAEPVVSLGGRPADLEAAMGRAAQILADARAAVVLGLGAATIEAQRHAVAIADRIGAVVGGTAEGRAGLAAYQRVGMVGATLGEVRDRADLVVYASESWPRALPRLVERFIDPPGRFVPEGRAGRTVVRLGEPAASAAPGEADDDPVDLTVSYRRSDDVKILLTLRALLDGASLDPAAVERSTGVPLKDLGDLADRMKRARYGAVFVAPSCRSSAADEAMLMLVRDLNRFTRFVAVRPTRDGANVAGAASVLAWQAGAAGDVDFALGYPRHLPREGAIERLERGEADAALLVGEIDGLGETSVATARLAAIPRVAILPDARSSVDEGGRSMPVRDSLANSDVFIPTARPAIDEAGTVARFDGVMLPLRPPFPGRRVSQVEVLRGIEDRIRARQDARR